ERLDRGLNHRGQIVAETVGRGGRAETVVVIESTACGYESGKHVVLDTGLGLAVGTVHGRSERVVRVGYRRGVPLGTERLHACESGRQRVLVAVCALGLLLGGVVTAKLLDGGEGVTQPLHEFK